MNPMRKSVFTIIIILFAAIISIYLIRLVLTTPILTTPTISAPISGVVLPYKLTTAQFKLQNANELNHPKAQTILQFEHEASMGNPRYNYNPAGQPRHEISFSRSTLKLRVTRAANINGTTRQLTAADGSVFELEPYSDSTSGFYSWGSYMVKVSFEQAYPVDVEKLNRQLEQIITSFKFS
jgi:hypothetical protein